MEAELFLVQTHVCTKSFASWDFAPDPTASLRCSSEQLTAFIGPLGGLDS